MPTVLTGASPRLAPRRQTTINSVRPLVGKSPLPPQKENSHSIKFQLFGAFFPHAFSRFDWLTSQMIAVIGMSE